MYCIHTYPVNVIARSVKRAICDRKLIVNQSCCLETLINIIGNVTTRYIMNIAIDVKVSPNTRITSIGTITGNTTGTVRYLVLL